MSAQKRAPYVSGKQKGRRPVGLQNQQIGAQTLSLFLDQNSALFEILTVSKGRCH